MNQELKDRLEEERKYYLRKTDIVPGTTMTVKEARAAYRKEVAEYEKAQLDAQIAFQASQSKAAEKEPAKKPATPRPEGDKPFTKSALKSKPKEEVVEIAKTLNLDVVGKAHTEDEIIDLILQAQST